MYSKLEEELKTNKKKKEEERLESCERQQVADDVE